MTASLPSLRRAVSRLAITCALVAALVPCAPPAAGAAVICQQQKKKPLVHLRANACRKTEQAVFDTQSETTQNQALTETVSVIGATCVGDPSRHIVPATHDVAGGLVLLGYISSSLCRTLDDDPTGCAAAFEPGMYGAGACVYLAGKCQLCDLRLDAAGVCRNVCQRPPASCALDPTRTTLLANCSGALSQPACEQAWTMTSGFMTPPDVMRGTSCFWNTGTCSQCTPEAISQGKCTNSCIATGDLPRCRASGRSFGDCSALDGNAAACGQTYELSGYGTQTCWYDAGTGHCNGCDPVAESKAQCSNGC